MSVTIVSSDSPQEITNAIGMYSGDKTETQKSAPVAETKEAQVASEVEAASETETDATEATDVDTNSEEPVSTEDVETTPDVEVQAPEKAAVKEKKGGFQRRIDKLTKDKSTAIQEAAYWKEQALKGSQKQTQETTQASAQGQQAVVQDAGKPHPDKFENVSDYMEALTDWKIEQKAQKAEIARKTEEAKSTLHNKIKTFHQKVGEFSKATPEYNEVAAEFDETYPSGMPQVMLDLIADSESGPQIMFDIAKDHQEFERLRSLSPIMLAREIGKREAKLSGGPGQTTIQKNTTTKAPAPISPVRGSSAVATKDPGKMSMQEYNAWRNAGGGR